MNLDVETIQREWLENQRFWHEKAKEFKEVGRSVENLGQWQDHTKIGFLLEEYQKVHQDWRSSYNQLLALNKRLNDHNVELRAKLEAYE